MCCYYSTRSSLVVVFWFFVEETYEAIKVVKNTFKFRVALLNYDGNVVIYVIFL